MKRKKERFERIACAILMKLIKSGEKEKVDDLRENRRESPRYWRYRSFCDIIFDNG